MIWDELQQQNQIGSWMDLMLRTVTVAAVTGDKHSAANILSGLGSFPGRNTHPERDRKTEKIDSEEERKRLSVTLSPLLGEKGMVSRAATKRYGPPGP